MNDVKATVKIKFYDSIYNLQMREQQYQNGRTALVFNDGVEVFGVLTVNVPEVPLREGEIIVKTYSENEQWVPQVLKALPEFFTDTHKRIQQGFATMAIWHYHPPSSQEEEEEHIGLDRNMRPEDTTPSI